MGGGLEPPTFRLTAGRCTSSTTPHPTTADHHSGFLRIDDDRAPLVGHGSGDALAKRVTHRMPVHMAVTAEVRKGPGLCECVGKSMWSAMHARVPQAVGRTRMARRGGVSRGGKAAPHPVDGVSGVNVDCAWREEPPLASADGVGPRHGKDLRGPRWPVEDQAKDLD